MFFLLSLYIQCIVRSGCRTPPQSIYLHMDTVGINTSNKTHENDTKSCPVNPSCICHHSIIFLFHIFFLTAHIVSPSPPSSMKKVCNYNEPKLPFNLIHISQMQTYCFWRGRETSWVITSLWCAHLAGSSLHCGTDRPGRFLHVLCKSRHLRVHWDEVSPQMEQRISSFPPRNVSSSPTSNCGNFIYIFFNTQPVMSLYFCATDSQENPMARFQAQCNFQNMNWGIGSRQL